MKSKTIKLTVSLMIILAVSCGEVEKPRETNIVFLHHSTGQSIWNGGNHPSKITRLAGKISTRLKSALHTSAKIRQLFREYNNENETNYHIKEKIFPKASPYGWKNYPYDYYNIWVKNAGEEPFMDEPTLEMLTKDFQVIMFKHCFPVSNIQEDLESPDINSDVKTLSNYKQQYLALRDKLHEFPDTKFILWTGAAQVESKITEDEALRAKEFFNWVTNKWDLPDDNIFIWDFYSLQTEGSLYFKNEYAASPQNSHPNDDFAEKAAKNLFNRIIDVVENNGNGTMPNSEEI